MSGIVRFQAVNATYFMPSEGCRFGALRSFLYLYTQFSNRIL